MAKPAMEISTDGIKILDWQEFLKAIDCYDIRFPFGEMVPVEIEELIKWTKGESSTLDAIIVEAGS